MRLLFQFLLSAAFILMTSQAALPVTVLPGEGVYFSQVEFINDTGSYPDSRTGRVEVDVAKTSELQWAVNRMTERALAEEEGGIPGYPCYRTVEETYADLAQLAVDYPQLATWTDIGDSWEKVTPGGLPGIETLLPLAYTYGVDAGRIQITDLVRLLCENPARLFGIAPQKGFLEPGSDADIVLYDPGVERALHHQDLHYLSGYSPYEGMTVKGEVKMTIARGEVIYRDGEILGAAGRGRFVPGAPFSADDAALP